MDYNSLIAEISAYVNRTDVAFTSQIPNFISQAVSRIYSQAKNIGFERVVTSNALLVANQPLINKPLDWIETVSIQYTIPGAAPQTVFLGARTYEFCLTYWSNPTAVAAPKFYANYGNQTGNIGNVGLSFDQFYIAPTPDVNYAGSIIYKGLPIFNIQYPTNFLTERYPTLLLDACLVEASPFLKNDERIPVWESRYRQSLQAVITDSEKRYIDRTSKRDVD